MSETFNVHEAKTHLSRLLDDARAGKEIIIAKAGEPYARLVAVLPQTLPQRRPGRFPGTIGPEFFEPMTEEELAMWEQGPIEPEVEPPVEPPVKPKTAARKTRKQR